MAAAAADAATARDGQTALALRLAKHLAPQPAADDDSAAPGAAAMRGRGGNAVFSPAAVHAALALVAVAAGAAHGATRDQLLAFLGAPSPPSLSASRGASSATAAGTTPSSGRTCCSGAASGWTAPAAGSPTRSAASPPSPTTPSGCRP